MLRNYLKVFLRLFLKQTLFTLINIVGLAVGLACCLIIALYVRHELSFDRFFTNADNLYRVNTVATAPSGEVRELGNTYFPVAPLLEANLPGVVDTARWDPHVSTLTVGDANFAENEFKMVDPAFFRLFDIVWLEGDFASAFSGATDVVVTRSFTEKYFGAEPALGQSIQMAQGPLLRVTGVIEDLPVNTHLSGSAFASVALRDLLGADPQRGWAETGYYTYALLQPGIDLARFQQELDELAQANLPQPGNARYSLELQPITAIHMNPMFGDWPAKPQGNKLALAVFSAIGIGILLIACANFVNLSTARSSQRFNEVGMRLTFGARRTQLLTQFLGESVLFVLLAILVALSLVEFALPPVQALLGFELAFDSLLDPATLAKLLAAGLVLGLLAGWYPAVLMSGYRPVTVLKDTSRAQMRGMALKNVLAVLQFAIAIGMVIAATVIYLQMRHTGNLDLGYATDGIVDIVTDDRAGSYGRREPLKEAMLRTAGVTAASLAGSPPAQGGEPAAVTTEGADVVYRLRYNSVDFDYFALHDIALLAGRLPDPDRATDRVMPAGEGRERMHGSFVLNASAARELGWSREEAVGKLLNRDGAWYEVIGVVEDVIVSANVAAWANIYAVPANTESLYRLSVKLDTSDLAVGMAAIERTWTEVNPGEPLTSISINELVALNYADAKRLEKLVFLFAGMAVFISCMGLFGLANFNAQRRVKEIGVRKVMGGSVWSIVLLLTNDFSKLVLLSNLLAWPVAYFAMQRWLENFAYRIDLTPLIFIGSGLTALCIAWVTVGGTAAKAASAKPVLALKYE